MKYYLTKNNVLEEVTQETWVSVIGENPYREYAKKVYRNQMFIDDVPEEYREQVSSIVQNKIDYFGEYVDEISNDELGKMVKALM